MINFFLQHILGLDAETAARAVRYSAAGVIGIIAGIFFTGAARLIIAAVSAILNHVV